jgi:hypothetical protein
MPEIKATVQRLIEDRPADIPEGWLIFNAPRPLWGQRQWTGEFRHGIFYAAVDPAEPDTKQLSWMLQQNADLDGWLLEYVTMDQVRAYLDAECAKRNLPATFLGRYSQSQLQDMYITKQGRTTKIISVNDTVEITDVPEEA